VAFKTISDDEANIASLEGIDSNLDSKAGTEAVKFIKGAVEFKV